jgi:hypothetical protein
MHTGECVRNPERSFSSTRRRQRLQCKRYNRQILTTGRHSRPTPAGVLQGTWLVRHNTASFQDMRHRMFDMPAGRS